ncbi:MAG: HigA family addiction module antidote protein [Erysipelotrichaceae bacterium]|nr:HigA family addiction module antidote protein [Erysipelotrichaceae bacterium]
MSNTITYKELSAFHPGYYVEEVIDDLGISQEEFAARLGTTPKTVSKLVNAQCNLTDDLARKLSSMMGTSIELWINLQKQYDIKIQEIQQAKEIESQIPILNKIDYSYFVREADLPDTADKEERIRNLCKYLRVADLNYLAEPDLIADLGGEKIVIETRNSINSRAWLQTAINIAQDIDAQPYNAKILKNKLLEIRDLADKKPKSVLSKIQEILSACGVVFVLLPHLKYSDIDGAVKWLNNDKAVVAFSDKKLDDGTFWLTLFKNIKHVLQKKTKTVFLDMPSACFDERIQKFEKEAKEFAERNLASIGYDKLTK